MRSKDLKQGLVVAIHRGQLDSHSHPNKGVVLADGPWITDRGYGKAEERPWPEDVLPVEGRSWTSKMPRRTEKWTDSRYAGFEGTISAGVLVLETMGSGAEIITVAPLTRIKGEYEEVLAKVQEMRAAREARELDVASARHAIRTRFISARTTANLAIERELADHHEPISENALYLGWHGGQVRLSLDQFEALVELSRL